MFTISSSDDETNIPYSPITPTYSPISSQPTRYIYDSMQIFFLQIICIATLVEIYLYVNIYTLYSRPYSVTSNLAEESFSPSDIKDCIRQLEIDNEVLSMPCMTLEFRRDFCLEDAIRHSKKQKFDPQKQLKVN